MGVQHRWVSLLGVVVGLASVAHGARPDATEAWFDVVLRASGHDGVTATAEQLEAGLADACKAGVSTACEPPPWLAPFDPEAAGPAAAALCDGGDAVACLLAGWTSDGDQASAHLQAACEAGLARACTEVALARGATADDAELQKLCDGGEPRACRATAADGPEGVDRLRRAAELGDAWSLWRLAEVSEGDERAERLVEACAAGVGEACFARARAADGEVRATALGNGCALSHAPSCAHQVLQRLAAEELSRKEAAAELAKACKRYDRACADRELVSRRVVPPAFTPGRATDPAAVEALVGPMARRCYQDRLSRGDASGDVAIDVRTDAEGRLVGLVGRSPYVDEVFGDCLVREARKAPDAVAVDGGAAQHVVELTFGHVAEVSFASASGKDVAALEAALGELGDALDACALGQNVDLEVPIEMKTKGSGQVKDADLSELPGTMRGCVGALLLGAELGPVGGHKGVLTVRFFQPAE